MPKTLVEVILVTADVYDLDTAIKHYTQEEKVGRYFPMILVRRKDVRGRELKTYCVCRAVLNTDDIAFADSMRRMAQKNKRSAAFVEAVNDSSLFAVSAGELMRLP